MATSLILCTRNGGERMLTCLAHIEALDAGPDFDVVLVDNNSDDGFSWEKIQEHVRTSRHACQAIRCTRPGNSAGRNDGIAVAKGDIFIFIDDDCYADPRLVRTWEEIFSTHDVGYGTGMVRRHDPAMSMLGCRETPEIQIVPAGTLMIPGFLKGSNMAFRKECFDKAGLFDERFGSGVPFAGEDWDMSLRLSFAGFPAGYFPAPRVSHDHRRPDAGLADDRLDFYEYGNGAVYAKHMRGRQFLPLLRRFIRHARKLRRTPGRLGALLKGFRDYRALKRGLPA